MREVGGFVDLSVQDFMIVYFIGIWVEFCRGVLRGDFYLLLSQGCLVISLMSY